MITHLLTIIWRLDLCVVILQSWCIRSWFWWSRSWGAAAFFWSGLLVKPSGSALDLAAAAASVYHVCPCHGIYTCLYKYSLGVTVLALITLNRDLCHNQSSYLYYIIISLYTLSISTAHSLIPVYISHLSLDGIIQAIVILAEGGCPSVCNPKDGALCPRHSTVDKRQLWSLWCKYLKCFSTYLIVLKIQWAWHEIEILLCFSFS